MLRLGPRDAVHGLVGVVADGADGVALGLARRVALVALKAALDDRARLPQVALRAALDQGHAGGEAHPVDVAARVDVVEAVEHDVEGAEEVEGELWRLDVAVRRLDRELLAVRELEHRLPRDLRLGAADVLGAEEELAVEVGVVDRVEIHHRDVLDPGQDLRATVWRCRAWQGGCVQRGRPSHQILNELAADAACTDDQNFDGGEVGSGELLGVRHPCGGLFACSLQGGHAPIESMSRAARHFRRLGGASVVS